MHMLSYYHISTTARAVRCAQHIDHLQASETQLPESTLYSLKLQHVSVTERGRSQLDLSFKSPGAHRCSAAVSQAPHPALPKCFHSCASTVCAA
eukprot:6703-Heterococcus_DN1.PRE.8